MQHRQYHSTTNWSLVFAVFFFSLKMWAAVCSLLFYPSHLVFFLDNIRIHANARIGVISEDLSNTIELKYWSMICVFCHGLLDWLCTLFFLPWSAIQHLKLSMIVWGRPRHQIIFNSYCDFLTVSFIISHPKQQLHHIASETAYSVLRWEIADLILSADHVCQSFFFFEQTCMSKLITKLKWRE